MVGQYSPDPPREDSQDIKPVPSLQNDMFGDSDSESDDGDEFAYEGYEPIPMCPELDLEDETLGNDTTTTEAAAPIVPNTTPASTNSNAEAVIVSEVWSGPSDVNIPMDAAKEDLVRSAMANFTLPPSSIPEWASTIPEEEWKKQLVDRIKNMQS